jgi:hypothetical protein
MSVYFFPKNDHLFWVEDMQKHTFALLMAVACLNGGNSIAMAQSFEAQSGQLQELAVLGTFDKVRCASFPTGKIEFSQPANGTLTTQEGELVYTRGACKGKKFKLTFLYYKSNPGFRGIDRGSVTYGAPGFTDGGNDRKIDVITVRVE